MDCRFVSAMGCGENLIVDMKLDSVDGGIDCGMDCRINCRDTESTPACCVVLWIRQKTVIDGSLSGT